MLLLIIDHILNNEEDLYEYGLIFNQIKDIMRLYLSYTL